MSKFTLTEARVKVLKSRPSSYDTRDGKLEGFGVRVLPSGAKRSFVHRQHRGECVWKMLGDADTLSVYTLRTLFWSNVRQ